MNTNHTPGPWSELWQSAPPLGFLIIKDALSPVVIASVQPGSHEKADALLICAAPEMLQALHAANCYLASESPSIYDVMTAREFIVNAIYKADPQHDFRDFKTKKTQP